MKLPFFLAKRFVAGETFEQSVPKVAPLNARGIHLTMDLLGENVKDRTTADDTVEQYIGLLDKIGEAGLDSTISIKLTMMGLDIDRSYCRDNLFRLLEAARSHDQFVRIDMEGSDYTQATMDLFKEAFAEFGSHVGIVIQAYLHRTEKDIRELAELGADVRLCKGAYKEPPERAIQDMPGIRAAFKSYAATLLRNTPCPRIATHDDELIDWVLDHAREHDIAPSRFEFQMLYGLRQETMEDLASRGYNTRIYVPYGTMWFPYFKRRLMERKENIWFVLTTLFKK
ncbi:MAG: proline dehydrogenase family protein [Balneolaceae bacterium]|nr:proline dehydrogenase family protein [Balneolaceae bacterium]